MTALHKIIAAVAVVFLIQVLNLAGEADAMEERNQEARYCAMVEAGAWPDYENRYNEDCAGSEV